MEKSTYIYETYIRTTPQKLWRALITPEFQEKYFASAHFETDWKPGSPWKLMFPDGTVADAGTVVETKPSKRLVLRWRHEMSPAIKAEGYGRCVMEIKPAQGAVKLTITHSINKPKSKLIKAVSGGWPFILSNLKSMLETGKVVLKGWPD